MKETWFKRMGWTCISSHPMGFVITLLTILFMIPVCIAVVRNGHSVTDDLYSIFVFGTCTAFWWKWVAEKMSKERG